MGGSDRLEKCMIAMEKAGETMLAAVPNSDDKPLGTGFLTRDDVGGGEDRAFRLQHHCSPSAAGKLLRLVVSVVMEEADPLVDPCIRYQWCDTGPLTKSPSFPTSLGDLSSSTTVSTPPLQKLLAKTASKASSHVCVK